MRTLILGCGYVGTALGHELAKQGHEVFGVRRGKASAAGLREAKVTPVSADITNAADLNALPNDWDWVVNCVSAGGGGAAAYNSTYLEGTRRLLTWLAGNPPKKFIYTSSTGVYGQNDGSTVTEASERLPEGETGRVLVAAEDELLHAAVNNGFPAVIMRLAGIYGPDRGYWLKQFLAGEARLEGNGGRILNMVHRDDVVGSILAALVCGRNGEAYNVVDDEPATQLQVFQWLAATLKRPMPAAVPEPEIKKRGAANKRVSNEKLKRELGYCFKYPDFRAGYKAELAERGPSRRH